MRRIRCVAIVTARRIRSIRATRAVDRDVELDADAKRDDAATTRGRATTTTGGAVDDRVPTRARDDDDVATRVAPRTSRR